MEYQGTGLREQGTEGTPSVACGDSSLREGATGGAATVRTAEIVAAEIRDLQAMGRGMYVWIAVEIGRRLVEAKAMVGHGNWLKWLRDNTGYSQPTASRIIGIFEKFGAEQITLFGAVSKYSTLNNLEISKAALLLDVPDEELEEYAAVNDVEHKTVAELQALKRERDEARKAREEAERRAAEAEKSLRSAQDDNRAELEASEQLRAELSDEMAGKISELEEAKRKIAELEARPVEAAVAEPDPEEIERRAAALIEETRNVAEAKVKTLEAEAKAAQEEHEQRLKELQDKAKAEREKLKEKLKAAEEKAEKILRSAQDDKEGGKAEEKLRREAEELKKKLAMSGEELVTFKLRFAAWQRAYNEMRLALDKLGEEQGGKCAAAVQKQLEAWEKADRSEFRDQSSEKGDEDREKSK